MRSVYLGQISPATIGPMTTTKAIPVTDQLPSQESFLAMRAQMDASQLIDAAGGVVEPRDVVRPPPSNGGGGQPQREGEAPPAAACAPRLGFRCCGWICPIAAAIGAVGGLAILRLTS